MEYAGYCLGQLHVIVLVSAASLILDSVTQEYAILKTKAVILEPTLALFTSCKWLECICISGKLVHLSTAEIKAGFCPIS